MAMSALRAATKNVRMQKARAGSKSHVCLCAAAEDEVDMDEIEDVVDRNIDRYFGHCKRSAIDAVVIDKLNLRQTMIRDRIELVKSGRQRADTEYFAQLKKNHGEAHRCRSVHGKDDRASAGDAHEGNIDWSHEAAEEKET